MDQTEINNWKTIAEKMAASGDTESWFYLRARAIADGKGDPMPNISQLMPESAWLKKADQGTIISGASSRKSAARWSTQAVMSNAYQFWDDKDRQNSSAAQPQRNNSTRETKRSLFVKKKEGIKQIKYLN